MSLAVSFQVAVGSEAEHQARLAAYEKARTFVLNKASAYGLSSSDIASLDASEKETLAELLRDQRVLDAHDPLVLSVPPSLVIGSLDFDLFPDASLKKTRENFKCLVTGEKGVAKGSKKPLHYKHTPIHRLAPGFVLQGGDTARGDGSGSDSIYGGKFAQDAAGLKIPFKRGTLGMASSGAGKVSSQFFVCLASDDAMLAKLSGKYVAFGQLKEASEAVLRKLEEVEQKDEVPLQPVWVFDCTVL